MATKYDTNPLDPGFPERIRAEAEAAAATQALPMDRGPATPPFAEPSPTDEELTRQFSGGAISGFTAQQPGQYQTVGFANVNQSLSRKVDKVGLPENVMTALPYIPWYIGMVAGILILFLVPKSEAKVRFHAAQGLAAHIAILIVSAILGFIGNITDLAEAGNVIFNLVTTIMLIVFAVKAWQGKPIHIESVDELTNWLEDKIKPSQTS